MKRYLILSLLVFSASGQNIDYRTQLKNLPVISLKDSPYFAKGNGVANDSTAFTSALATISSANGGKIILTPGTYMVINVSLVSNLTIECQAGVIIKQFAPFNADTDGIFNTATHLTNVHINCHDAIADGNKANQSGAITDGNGSFIAVNGWTNSSIDIGLAQNFFTDGLKLEGYSGSFIPSNHITVRGRFTAAKRCGIAIINATDVYIDAEVDNSLGTLPEAGLCIEKNNSTQRTNHIYAHLKSHDNNGPSAYYFEQFNSQLNSGVTIDCYECYNNQTYGVAVETFNPAYIISGVRVTGKFWNNGLAGAGYASVLFDANVIKSSISGNFNETNTGTVPFSVSGTNITVGDGYYSGPTYDGCLASGAVGQVSTGAIFGHDPATFNPSCTGILNTIAPSNLVVQGTTLTLNSNIITAGTGTLKIASKLGINVNPGFVNTLFPGQFVIPPTGINNTIFASPLIYSTGTVAITLNSSTVTGSGTSWSAGTGIAANSLLIINNVNCGTVSSVGGTTAITLTSGTSCTTGTGLSYSIISAYGWTLNEAFNDTNPDLTFTVNGASGAKNVLRLRADGSIELPTLPTSASGLPSHSVWSNSNILTVVP